MAGLDRPCQRPARLDHRIIDPRGKEAAPVLGALAEVGLTVGGIGDDTVRTAYSRAQVVEDPLNLATAMVEGVRSTLFKTVTQSGTDAWWVHTGDHFVGTLAS